MNQITVEIPEQYEQWLCNEATRRETTIEEIIREALYAYRGKPARKLRAAAGGGSGETDISERIEELLAIEWKKD
jgi:hypothetical protein